MELKKKIPWLAHGVVKVSSGPADSGHMTTKPWPVNVPRRDFFAKQLDHAMSPFTDLSEAGFPASMLPAELLEPWTSLPTTSTASLAPVVALQLNFIQGGVILTISTHHSIIDASGIISFRQLLAAVLNDEDISKEELAAANLDRAQVIPLLAPGEPIKNHGHLLRQSQTISPPTLPPAIWRVFRISREAVEEIKMRAGVRDSSWTPSVSHISTNDSLAAFCWQRFSVVRLPLLAKRRRCRGDARSVPHEHNVLTRFGRAIDGRIAMGIPNPYMGHMVYHAVLWLPVTTVATAPLPFLASVLRRTLDEANNAWSIRSYATFLSGQTDRSRLMYGGPQNPEVDFGVSSLITAFDWDGNSSKRFGPLLGEPAAWRKADHAPIPGCLYFLDTESSQDGDGSRVQTVLLCLPEDELDALGRDREWTKYFKPAVDLPVNVQSKL
ncbi:hypothetical protein GGR52DRAFT_547068 [Hypoxylon sp. FL1284]|nr:hypothetical protein GGR52DRAFT_547068 [Hypoxylon sp. FL1284]